MSLSFYEDPKNVEQYTAFTPAHDGAQLVDALRDVLPAGSTVLEIGMGPGKDFDLLAETYTVTGSDFSQAFLDRYRKTHEDADADLLQLDSRTLETDRTFDAIFSNKVLVHLDDAELQQSFARQREVLSPGGLVMHSFWYGQGGGEFGELTLIRRNEDSLRRLLEPDWEIIALGRHAKMSDGDSLYVIAKRI